jgi:hypothetical protein
MRLFGEGGAKPASPSTSPWRQWWLGLGSVILVPSSKPRHPSPPIQRGALSPLHYPKPFGSPHSEVLWGALFMTMKLCRENVYVHISHIRKVGLMALEEQEVIAMSVFFIESSTSLSLRTINHYIDLLRSS